MLWPEHERHERRTPDLALGDFMVHRRPDVDRTSQDEGAISRFVVADRGMLFLDLFCFGVGRPLRLGAL